jgi:glycosyltransferase involved in cell wall biosynthesis
MILSHITPVILTYNEEANIARTLSQLHWAQSVVILDSGSTDQTEAICRSFPTVHWHQRPFDTHAQQWNAALHLVQTPWALTMDADYLMSSALIDEITALPDKSLYDGYRIPFIYQINGHPLRQSLLPPRIALFQKNRGHYLQDGHTQDLLLQGNCGNLHQPFFHDDRKPFSRWWSNQQHYARQEAEKLYSTPWQQLSLQDRLRKCPPLAPLAVIFWCLIVKGLALNWPAGWIYTYQRTLAEALISLKFFLHWLKA